MPYLDPGLLEAFDQYLRERERSPLSAETYRRDVRLFAAWFEEANGEEPTLASITTTDLREYKQHLRVVRKDQPATINRKLASLRVFLGWAQASGRLGDQPVPKVPRTVRREQLGPRWLGRRERLALLRAVERGGKPRDIAIVRFLLHTGVRVQELCELAWSDVRMSSRKGRVIVRHGKGAKQREVPLNKEARDALEGLGFAEHAGSEARVFQGQRGPLSKRGVQLVLRRYATRSGLDGVTPHTLRHTFCKTLIDAGAQLQEVAALAGHESLETTRRYCEPSLIDLEKAVDRLSADA